MRRGRMGILVGIALVVLFVSRPVSGTAAEMPGGESAEEPAGVWTGRVEAGLITATGNAHTRTATGEVEAEKETARDAWVLRAGALSSTNNGEKSAEALEAEGTYRYRHTARTYSHYSLAWERDPLAGLRARFTARAGVGHLFREGPRDRIVGEAGLGYVYEDEEEENHDFPEGRLFGRWEHTFREGAVFSQEVEWLQDVTLLRDFRINSETALMMELNRHWAVKTALTVRYDHEPAEGFLKTDTITQTSLVYRF